MRSRKPSTARAGRAPARAAGSSRRSPTADAPASSTRWIGQPVKRVEDARLLSGRGTFIGDHDPIPNVHHAAIVRSPHPHARITGYDVAAALAMEGVVGV